MTDQSPNSPKDHVPRWQSEVEEILEQSDRESTSFEKARAAAIATRYKAPDKAKHATEQASSRLGNAIWLVAAVALGVAAWLVGLHWPVAGRVLAIASLLLFVAFLINAMMRSRRGKSTPKLWRGKDLSDESGPPSWRGVDRGSRDEDDDPPLIGSGR